MFGSTRVGTVASRALDVGRVGPLARLGLAGLACLVPLLGSVQACSLSNELFSNDASEIATYRFPKCIVASGAADRATLSDETGTAKATASGGECDRTFSLESTADRRDNLPESPRQLTESGGSSLQTTNALFDALYRLALEEARECSVAAIRDWAWSDGAEVPCPAGGCFETGRKWNYVWTRDTSYAADLGLGWVDPVRMKNSLEFKLSVRRDDPNDLQIVQDTGTGGSYPVSSDRAVWALGARAALRHLSGSPRAAFRDLALRAATNTARHDREVVFDTRDGLYRGEQSFLDWRAQTYPGWTVPNTVHIGMSKALSTNLAHLSLLDLATSLAKEAGDAKTASELGGWALDLRRAIRAGFWLPERGLLSTYRTTELDPSPVDRYDLLGTSLAVLLDATSPSEAKTLIARYPTLPKGPPVVFPQQQEVAVYHNRAIWPFVTGYWAKAARKVESDAAFDAAVLSLVRGAALNLSNMENLEVASGKAWLEDGPYSGPVVNSQRQLWSVAAYVGVITESLFGIEPENGGVRVAPFVTGGLHAKLFPSARSIALNDVPLRGKRVTVVVKLPASGTAGAYRVARVRFNGRDREVGFASDRELGERNLFEIELAPGAAPTAVRSLPASGDYRMLYGPRTPSLSLSGATIRATFPGESPDELVWAVFRDGVRIASNLDGAQSTFVDPAAADGSAHCYAIDATYRVSGNASQHAEPVCTWSGAAPAANRVRTISSDEFTVVGGRKVEAYGRRFYEAWGDPGHEIRATFTATRSGEHLVQATYGNGAAGIDTGITCAVKYIAVEDAATGAIAGDGYLVMPQRGDWSSWGDSSFVRTTLAAGRTYRLRIAHERRSYNMSGFRHFDAYTGGAGGRGGAFFRVNIAELKLIARDR